MVSLLIDSFKDKFEIAVLRERVKTLEEEVKRLKERDNNFLCWSKQKPIPPKLSDLNEEE